MGKGFGGNDIFFKNRWSKSFLIFSFLLILGALIVVIIFGPPEGDTLKFQDILEVDSLRQIEDIRDREIHRGRHAPVDTLSFDTLRNR